MLSSRIARPWGLRLAVACLATLPGLGLYFYGAVQNWEPVKWWGITLIAITIPVAALLPSKRAALWFAAAAIAISSLDILEALGY